MGLTASDICVHEKTHWTDRNINNHFREELGNLLDITVRECLDNIQLRALQGCLHRTHSLRVTDVVLE